MAPRCERVDGHDAGDADSWEHALPDTSAPAPASATPAPQVTPSSPPPSFRSRASSSATARRHGGPVDPALADAFGSDPDASDHDDDDDSDGDDDVRRRLMRPSTAMEQQSGASTTAGSATAGSAYATAPTIAPTTANSQPPAARPTTGRIYGSGLQSDGVFRNMSARPEVGGQGEKDEAPPSYEQAAADQAPPYWETTILAPGLGGPDEVFLDGMPIGSLFSFLWNATISMSFQLVGFLLTYLLHATHAAKNGSRAGLGVTLIQYGFYLRSSIDDGSVGSSATGADADGYAAPADPNAHNFDPNNLGSGGGDSGSGSSSGFAAISASEWGSYILMVVGWFILIRAVSDYLRARRHEMLVLGSPESRRFGVVSVFAAGEHPERVV